MPTDDSALDALARVRECAAAASAEGRSIGRRQILAAIHESHFHLGAVVEDVAAGDHEVGDFPLLDGAEAIGDADWARAKAQHRNSAPTRFFIIAIGLYGVHSPANGYTTGVPTMGRILRRILEFVH
jgi:hypothetical protein